MSDMETLLRRDRAAGIPESPDVRYTVAVVRRMLAAQAGPGRKAPATAPGPSGSGDWPLLLIAGATLLASVGAALTCGLNPWWLMAIPLAAIPLCPILLRKGV